VINAESQRNRGCPGFRVRICRACGEPSIEFLQEVLREARRQSLELGDVLDRHAEVFDLALKAFLRVLHVVVDGLDQLLGIGAEDRDDVAGVDARDVAARRHPELAVDFLQRPGLEELVGHRARFHVAAVAPDQLGPADWAGKGEVDRIALPVGEGRIAQPGREHRRGTISLCRFARDVGGVELAQARHLLPVEPREHRDPRDGLTLVVEPEFRVGNGDVGLTHELGQRVGRHAIADEHAHDRAQCSPDRCDQSLGCRHPWPLVSMCGCRRPATPVAAGPAWARSVRPALLRILAVAGTFFPFFM